MGARRTVAVGGRSREQEALGRGSWKQTSGVLRIQGARSLPASGVRSWLGSAVRRTRWAAAAVVVIAVVAGHLIQHFAPDTVSIGDLWR